MPSSHSSLLFSHSVVSNSLPPHGLPVLHYLLEFAQTHVPWISDAIQPSVVPFSCPLTFPSIRVFSDESVLCIRWPKYWSFSFSISPSNEYSGLISFRMDWLGLLAVQGVSPSVRPYLGMLGPQQLRVVGKRGKQESPPTWEFHTETRRVPFWKTLIEACWTEV